MVPSKRLIYHLNEISIVPCNSSQTHIEPLLLQPESDKIQEVHELTEHDAFGCSILLFEVSQFFNKSFYFGRGTPIVQIESTKYTLPGFRVLLEFKSGGFQVDGQRQMANWTVKLMTV
jgi:hypothetical protein